MLVRERQSLGFYVSGHPLDRYSKGRAALASSRRSRSAECAAMADWSVVKLAGMVEGYREKVFKDGGGKLAFFELEDLSGRVNVKLRGARHRDVRARCSREGEPVLVTGKVSFPRRDEDAPEEEPEGAARADHPAERGDLLGTPVKAGTKADDHPAPARRRPTWRAREDAGSPGRVERACPVTLQLTMPSGGGDPRAGKQYRVEVGDPLLAGLERVFGEQVAELR